MERRISFQQYRTIDLTILAVILAVCQFVIHLAVSYWYPEQLYVVTPVAAVTALVMMRWSGWAAVQALLGGALYAALSGGTVEQVLIYGVGNLASLLALVMFRLSTKERIRQDAFLSLTFALLTQLLMWLGRAGVAAVFGYTPEACLGFVTTDILSGLFTLFIIWIVRRIDGLFEDQKTYLLRMQSEQQAEGRDQL